jgi:hypothetical protein
MANEPVFGAPKLQEWEVTLPDKRTYIVKAETPEQAEVLALGGKGIPKEPTLRERATGLVRGVTDPIRRFLQEAEANRQGYQPVASTINRTIQAILPSTPEGAVLTGAPIVGPIAGKFVGKVAEPLLKGLSETAAARVGAGLRAAVDPFAAQTPLGLIVAPTLISGGVAAATGASAPEVLGAAGQGALAGIVPAGVRYLQAPGKSMDIQRLLPMNREATNKFIAGLVAELPDIAGPALAKPSSVTGKAPLPGEQLLEGANRIQEAISGLYRSMLDTLKQEVSGVHKFPNLALFRGQSAMTDQPRVVVSKSIREGWQKSQARKLEPQELQGPEWAGRMRQSTAESQSKRITEPQPPPQLDEYFTIEEALNTLKSIPATKDPVMVWKTPKGDKPVSGFDMREMAKKDIVNVLRRVDPKLADQFRETFEKYARGARIASMLDEMRLQGVTSTNTDPVFGGVNAPALQEFLLTKAGEYGVTSKEFPRLFRSVFGEHFGATPMKVQKGGPPARLISRFGLGDVGGSLPLGHPSQREIPIGTQIPPGGAGKADWPPRAAAVPGVLLENIVQGIGARRGEPPSGVNP